MPLRGSLEDVLNKFNKRLLGVERRLAGGGSGGASVPPGTIVMFGGTVVPDGWLLCNGQERLVADFPELAAALGTSWGEGFPDPTLEFVLPDFNGRFPLGKAFDTGVGMGGGNASISFSASTVAVPNGQWAYTSPPYSVVLFIVKT